MPHPVKISANVRFSFLAKLAGAAVVLAVGDALLYGFRGGAVIGLFALVWLAALALARPSTRRAHGGWLAIGGAALFAGALIHNSGPLAALLFLIAIGSAALLPRHVFDHAGLWALRLATLGLFAPFRSVADAWRIASLPGRGGSVGKAVALNLALPLAGGGLFLALFASANPVLGNAFAGVQLPDLGTLIEHILLVGIMSVFVWPTLRPRAVRLASGGAAMLPRFPDGSVTLMATTLIVFNAVFALQNGLDILFLWSGAPLPEGITLAQYAHQGAYTLIATALLAGLFVLLALRPGSASAQSPTIRMLLLVWVGQNVLLVASSILRVIDYIDVYSLTEWRIAALIWMVLVAVGLMLTGWRFLSGRSAGWLINANTLAAGAVLTVSTVVDYGAVAARWNVDHANALVALDLCYLNELDSAALLPLIDLRDTPAGDVFHDPAVFLSEQAYRELARQQADWQSWTLRGAMRLAEAEARLAGDTRKPLPAPNGRECDGGILPPPPPPPSIEVSATLTPEQIP
jgi:Domain of unknown function (DUF4173)